MWVRGMEQQGINLYEIFPTTLTAVCLVEAVMRDMYDTCRHQGNCGNSREVQSSGISLTYKS